jgi:hypothetical protein
MCSASLMTRRSIQLRKAPSFSKPGGFRDALNQQFCTADSANLESSNIRQAVYSSVLRHRENHSSNCSNWLREISGFVPSDVKKISVVVVAVIVSSLDEETRANGAYSMTSKRRHEPGPLVDIRQAKPSGIDCTHRCLSPQYSRMSRLRK